MAVEKKSFLIELHQQAIELTKETIEKNPTNIICAPITYLIYLGSLIAQKESEVIDPKGAKKRKEARELKEMAGKLLEKGIKPEDL